MVRHILPIVDSIPHTVYGEPFCGGASVLFARKPRAVGNTHHYREYINDTNEWVTTFYRVGQTYPDRLIRLINATLYSESDHRKAKGILKNSVQHSELEVAWAFYVQANMSFANRLFGGWGSTVCGENHAATWHRRKTTLAEALDRLSQVAISCDDAINVIKRWDSPQTLHYIDPPYPSTNQGHYAGYTLADWEKLCNCLDTIHGSYILSCYPQEVEPKSAQQRIEVETLSSASGEGKTRVYKTRSATKSELGDRKRTEVLWVCDRSANMRSELIPIAAKHVTGDRTLADSLQGSTDPAPSTAVTKRYVQTDLLDLCNHV